MAAAPPSAKAASAPGPLWQPRVGQIDTLGLFGDGNGVERRLQPLTSLLVHVGALGLIDPGSLILRPLLSAFVSSPTIRSLDEGPGAC